ncbi:THAP domain-containing protein 5 isoform X2 [Etheostoma spectabile]|uniref:THAP domain-containing protein 5 isoform X2 n=1 Tax=Etheostoma spectabile TaxID=54343 RepID=UPI0013AECE02|nr:THAP domain-containing protein 5-like isoform X2 [Etheostoma spectabile]
MACSAFRCHNTQRKDSTVMFFRFPLCDPDRLKQWLKNMGRKKWTPSALSHLCSTHFEDDQFLSDRNVNKRLKTTAVPTIFIHPPHFATQTRARQTRATETRATQTSSPKSRSTQTMDTQTRATETRATQTRSPKSRSTQTMDTQTEWVNVKMDVGESMVSSFVPSSSSPSYIAEPGPGTRLCSVLDSEPVTNIDIKDRCSIPSPDYSDRGVGLGVDRGLSTQGSYVRRDPKDARMKSCGYREGSIENAFLEGPEFHATPLYNNVSVKQEPAEETDVVVKQEPAEETDVVDTVLPDYIVKVVIKADVNEAAAEDNPDVDEFAADDITEYPTSGDSKTVILDHGYFSKKQKEIRKFSDHMYVISESPIILKRRVNELCDKLVEARKKFKLKCQETRRRKSKLVSLKILTKGLQKKLNSLQKKLKVLQKPNGGTVQNVQEPFFIWVPCV